ncbi:cell wall-binding repeat-containing protein [Peptacetobacter sp.]|uniref:cell wall-binding repeat-containing protein n=1 Tax=Peptacetobacter sp. TaxID=2991975 RepID=UPI00260E0D58|nr:cell wall-binding repeat-containing protein [Peptacetobacter sp.]
MKFRKKSITMILTTALIASSAIISHAIFMKEEIVGSNRYETAAKIADRMGEYSVAILVNGNSISDGLSASGLAGKENAPILLTKKYEIPQETLEKLFGVEKIYIVGGEGAISKNVEKELNNYGLYTERIAGKDRIETSLEVSKEIGNYSKVFLVNGFKGEADAMSVASVSARDKTPIILTNGKEAPTYKKNGVIYYVVGGNAVMSDSLQYDFDAERLSGSNRYTTNKAIFERFYNDTNKIYFAKGDLLIDALAVSPLSKNNGLILVGNNSDKTTIYGKEHLIQVGGMSRIIVDQVIESIYSEPQDNIKPNEEQPQEEINPDENTETLGDTYDINSAEFQDIVRTEFYRLLDEYRAREGKRAVFHYWRMEESSWLKSKHMIDNNYFSHNNNGIYLEYPHHGGGAECIAGNWFTDRVTEYGGKK